MHTTRKYVCHTPDPTQQSLLVYCLMPDVSHRCSPALFSPSPTAVDAAVELITGRQPELTSEGNGPLENHAMANKSLKRPNADSDEEDDKGAVAPPVHDIYRARQQKRIR